MSNLQQTNHSSSQIDKLSYSVRRRFVDEFYQRHVMLLPKDWILLDLGGNRIQKRGQFDVETYLKHVIYANLSAEKKPDVQTDAALLPLTDNCLDVVICSEVLEHVPNPIPVLHEVYRVLQPGGKLFMSVPFLHPIHADPYDFGRYTDFYWEKVLEQAGFVHLIIERQGTFHMTLVHQFKMYANKYCPRPFRRAASVVFGLWERAVRRYETKPRVQSDPFLTSYTTGFGILAHKKDL